MFSTFLSSDSNLSTTDFMPGQKQEWRLDGPVSSGHMRDAGGIYFPIICVRERGGPSERSASACVTFTQ